MISRDDNSESSKSDTNGSTSRRAFLRNIAAGAAFGVAFNRAEALLHAATMFDDVTDRRPVSGATTLDQPAAPTAVSRVVKIVDPNIIPGSIVQRALLRSHLIDGLRTFGNTDSHVDALQAIFKPDDTILLKFNQSAANRIGTCDAMAAVLIELLIQAGFSPDRLIVLEAGGEIDRTFKTKKPDLRWQGRMVDFGRSGRDSFTAALDQATAIINVPFLKTHHLATMTGCLKNLSHGLIRRPARFHSGGCDPAIAEIVASPDIRDKLKLNIVNGLRVMFDRGPEASEDEITTTGHLLIGSDPVACDAVGYSVLNSVRKSRGLGPLLPDERLPRQLLTAFDLGLGQYDELRIGLQSPAG